MSSAQPVPAGPEGVPAGSPSPLRKMVPALLATAGIVAAVAAQLQLDNHPDAPFDGLFLFVVAIVCWLLALRRAPLPVHRSRLKAIPGPPFGRRHVYAVAAALGLVGLAAVLWPAISGPGGGGLGLLAYPGGPEDPRGTLTTPGLILWIGGIALYAWAVGDWRRPRGLAEREMPDRRRVIEAGLVALAFAIVLLVAAWFRLVDLDTFPREMTSDHTEKLLDIRDILLGWRPAFLHGNAGREPLQFYMTAAMVRAGMPLSFGTLKLGMALVSIVTVGLVYWAAREINGRLVGIAAAAITALMPWHLQVTRQSLRIGFAAFFVALTFALLYRALRTGKRNDWLFVGACMGVGLYGYTGFRMMLLAAPLVVLVRVAYDAWARRPDHRSALSPAMAGHLLGAIGLVVVLAAPMARYALDRPDPFWYRTRTRMTDLEQPLERPAAQQFLLNGRTTLLMFNRTSDAAWFNSPPGRPALETIGGALLVLGIATALAGGVRGDWRLTGALITLPVLLLSTAMALAFPIEVPSLGRAAAAIPVVATLAALPVYALWTFWRRAPWRVGAVVFVLLCTGLFLAMGQNMRTRVFDEYKAGFDNASHPTREGAEVIEAFVALGGDKDHAYLLSWPHAWDYRALALELGDPEWRNVLEGSGPEMADAVSAAYDHKADPARKLYLVGGPDDIADRNLEALQDIYPKAIVTRHAGHHDEKAFYSVYVPGDQPGGQWGDQREGEGELGDLAGEEPNDGTNDPMSDATGAADE